MGGYHHAELLVQYSAPDTNVNAVYTAPGMHNHVYVTEIRVNCRVGGAAKTFTVWFVPTGAAASGPFIIVTDSVGGAKALHEHIVNLGDWVLPGGGKIYFQEAAVGAGLDLNIHITGQVESYGS